MNDAELRQYVRKHGRREVLSAILEGLSTYEQAELFREHTRIHPILLAMTGEEFKLMGPDAQVVSARFGNEPRSDKATKQRVLDGEKGFVQGFQIHYDVAYRAGQSKPSVPRFPPAGPFAGSPDIYITPTVSRAMLRGLTEPGTLPYVPAGSRGRGYNLDTYRAAGFGVEGGPTIEIDKEEVGRTVDYLPDETVSFREVDNRDAPAIQLTDTSFDEHRDSATGT